MRLVIEADTLGRALRRIAHEIAEANRSVDDVVLLGIPTRGVPLAGRLAASLCEITGKDVPVGVIDTGPYRDDLTGELAAPAEPLLPCPLEGRTAVLVDDVVFTGRTIRAALDAVADLGRPERVQVAVVVDRGHRELPIRPDFVAKNVPTNRGERVAVRLSEIDGEDAVYIEAARTAVRSSRR